MATALKEFGWFLVRLVGALICTAIIITAIKQYRDEQFAKSPAALTTITAHEGENAIIAKVFVDGEEKGETPLQLRLGKGNFTIKVVPPTGYRSTRDQVQLTTEGVGMKIDEEMVKIHYQVKLHSSAGKRTQFSVIDVSNQNIGSCVGPDCTVELPKPGIYYPIMRACSDDGLFCFDGKGEINLSPEQEEAQFFFQ